jgi:hypothetical protein
MTIIFSRDSRVVIKEAELLSSSNDFIYSFFFQKASGVDRLRSSELEIDEITESKLLSKMMIL